MSYELEAKKRKFDRILESLTDGPSSVRAPVNARNNGATLTLTNGTLETSKRRRITPTSTVTKSAPTSSLTDHYLPSSRPAFLERLETYRQITQWHVPSTEPINASAWAKRGWICVDRDTVFCGPCKERLTIDLDLQNGKLQEPDATEESEEDNAGYSLAKEVYDALIRRYQEMIITAHSDSCPWRKRGCDSSIQRIEGLLNIKNAMLGLKERYNSIATSLDEVCNVSLSGKVTEEELQHITFDDNPTSADALTLAVCGWQRKCADVVECKYCFRSLGLWLYRGENPTIEKLDAVDSHLEYCPWRSPESQDSEISTSAQHENDSGPTVTKFCGWELVYQAVIKTNAKKASASRPATAITTSTFEGSTASDQTPEQREKRTRDLLQRIKDLRKPFNMKALLRKRNPEQERPRTAA